LNTEDWEQLLVVSQVELHDEVRKDNKEAIIYDGILYKITVYKAEEAECPRCWKHTKVKSSSGLCLRCEDVVKNK
jgi:isoleucyl-tRNA synthetase